MNLWDSVHRSLEKASHEAARLARTQRLRASMDSITRQVNTLHNTLIGRTMELYTAGQLTQNELLPICQELASLQQQTQQIQAELRQLQALQTQQQGAGPSPNAGPGGSTAQYPPLAEGTATYAPPPPDYQTYVDAGPTTAPPPPGEEGQAVSDMETVIAPPPPGMGAEQQPASAAADASRFCPSCHAEIQPGHAFCQHCGMPVQQDSAGYQPTMRSNASMPFSDQETIWSAEGTPPAGSQPGAFPPTADGDKGV